MGACDGFAAAVEADDFGRAFERAKHNDDAMVFAKVGGGFDAAAGVILIGHGHRAEHAEGIAAFGRDVDACGGRQRRGGYEKDALTRDPCGEFGIDFWKGFAHATAMKQVLQNRRGGQGIFG